MSAGICLNFEQELNELRKLVTFEHPAKRLAGNDSKLVHSEKAFSNVVALSHLEKRFEGKLTKALH